MRRFAVAFTLFYLTLNIAAANAWGQTFKFATPMTHAEDSPGAAENNQIFYDSPRTPEPQVSQPAGTVSVEQLQHPLSHKGEKLIRQAQNFAAMGDHDKAIAELQLALKEPSAIPYAHSLLGTEYLRTNQAPAAIEALEQAVKLLPRNAVNHANLGYALFLMGDAERAEQEVRRALDLDRDNEKTRRVLGLITHAGGSRQ
jgi:tetratricopeptide (TPR) repeat protein